MTRRSARALTGGKQASARFQTSDGTSPARTRTFITPDGCQAVAQSEPIESDHGLRSTSWKWPPAISQLAGISSCMLYSHLYPSPSCLCTMMRQPRCKRGGVTGVASKKVGVCDQSHTGVDQSAQTLMDLITAARRTSQYPLAVDMNIETNILCQLHLQQHTHSVGGYVL